MDAIIGTLLALVTFEALAIAGLILQGARERAQLLDRLMSQNWGSYLQGTRTVADGATIQLTTDEIEAKWYEAQEREAVANDAAGAHMVGT